MNRVDSRSEWSFDPIRPNGSNFQGQRGIVHLLSWTKQNFKKCTKVNFRLENNLLEVFLNGSLFERSLLDHLWPIKYHFFSSRRVPFGHFSFLFDSMAKIGIKQFHLHHWWFVVQMESFDNYFGNKTQKMSEILTFRIEVSIISGLFHIDPESFSPWVKWGHKGPHTVQMIWSENNPIYICYLPPPEWLQTARSS